MAITEAEAQQRRNAAQARLQQATREAEAALPDDIEIADDAEIPTSERVDEVVQQRDAARGAQPAAQPDAAAPGAGAAQPAATADAQPPATATPAPTADAQPPARPAAAAAQPAGVAAQPAAGAAAAQPEDLWNEYDEIEYADDDTGEKYTVRAPKKYADKVKNGYARRSIMDRNSRYFRQYQPWLEPIIADGSFERIAPLIQTALRDRELADAITEVYTRRTQGRPLLDAAAPPAAVSAPAAAAAAAPAAGQETVDILSAIDRIEDVDDYTREALKKGLAPVQEILNRRAALDAQNQRTAEQQRTQQQQAEDRRRAQVSFGIAARNELKRVFPNEFTDATPPERYTAVLEYAGRANMFETYGWSPATIVLAKMAMSNPLGLEGIGQPPAPTTAAPSTAAQTLDEVQRNGERLAAQAAAGVARTTATTGATAATPPASEERPAKRARIPRWVSDGRGGRRPLSATEVAKYMQNAAS
jgi:hypothetical protein